ncbi:MAG: hypothetical protein P4L35_04165 [Ignavibacteriaceae bacterium]|nr:hypothetical protein [Ignavibacteriaceae bacterium]
MDGYTAFVDVSYKTLGIYGGDIWTPKDTTEISHYYLANTVEGWKIDRLSIDNPRVSLDNILTIIPKSIKDSYKFMQNYKSNKGEYEEMLKMNNDREKSLKQLMELSNKRKQEKY